MYVCRNPQRCRRSVYHRPIFLSLPPRRSICRPTAPAALACLMPSWPMAFARRWNLFERVCHNYVHTSTHRCIRGGAVCNVCTLDVCASIELIVRWNPIYPFYPGTRPAEPPCIQASPPPSPRGDRKRTDRNHDGRLLRFPTPSVPVRPPSAHGGFKSPRPPTGMNSYVPAVCSSVASHRPAITPLCAKNPFGLFAKDKSAFSAIYLFPATNGCGGA